jgi:hypothetical protein
MQDLTLKCLTRVEMTIVLSNTTEKVFIISAPCGQEYKHVTIVIYDHSDSYNAIVIHDASNRVALAIARTLKDDRKVCSKLKHTFVIVNYKPLKPLI